MGRHRWSRLLLPAAVAVVLGGGWVVAPAAAAPGCLVPGPDAAISAPVLAPDETGLVAQAGALVEAGRLDAAERLYELVLEGDAPDPRGGTGLAFVQSRREAAERIAASAGTLPAGEEARDCFRSALELDRSNETALAGQDAADPDDGSPASRVADRWDRFYDGWIDPLTRLALPALALLTVLLILSRMLTSWAVPPAAREWRHRRQAWWLGIGLMVGAATAGGALAVSAVRSPAGLDWQWAPLALVALVVLAARAALRGSGQRSRSTLTIAVASVAVAALAIASGGEDVWPWALAVAVAWLGVVLAAIGRGHALRLRIVVEKGGTPDDAAAAYVLARLQELGSSPPEGLKAPSQVDVTDLPTAALSALPAGRAAAVLKQVVDLFLPSVPWRAVVAEGEGSTVVVTLTRNGSVAQTALVDPTRFLLPPAASPADVDRGDLLTAAAAVILTELAQRHEHLQTGLCGATRWDSVAAHVVATKPPGSSDGAALRRELLAYAVDVDPCNALAQAAYVHLLGETATSPEELEAHARRLSELSARIAGRQSTGTGYLLLQLRTLHARAAAWLNVAAARPGDGGARAEAVTALAELQTALRRATSLGDRRQEAFVREVAAIADELRVAAGLATALPAGPRAGQDPPSLHVLYDQACHAAMSDEPGTALEPLRRVAGRDALRKQARTDPCFASLRTGSKEHQRLFWALVGEPAAPPPFTGLDPFGEQGPRLVELGLSSPAELLAATEGWSRRRALARHLHVPGSVVGRWRRLAALAGPRLLRRTDIGARDLELLVAAGVTSAADLLVRTRAGFFRRPLLRAVAAPAAARHVPAPDDSDARRWLGLGR